MSILDLFFIMLFLGIGHFLCLHLMMLWNSDLFYDLFIDKSFNYYLFKKYIKRRDL